MAANTNLGTAWISIVPETDKIVPALKGEFEKAAKTAATAGGGIGNKLMSGLTKTLKASAASAGVAVGGVLSASIYKGMGRLTAIDTAQAKLKGLGNSAQDVASIMDNALASVKGTSYGLEEAATTSAGLVASGIKPGEQLQTVLSTVADSAAIAGTSMSEMGSIFNKVAANGIIQGDELAQLMDRGIPVLDILGQKLGKTSAEVRKMASEGEIDFQTFADAMRDKLGGSALSVGDTFSGALANMGAASGRFGAALMSPAFTGAPAVFRGLSDAFDSITSGFKPFSDQITTVLQPAFEQLGNGLSQGLAPKFEQLGGKIGELALQFANFVVDPRVWETVSNAFQQLSDAGAQLWPTVQHLLPSLGQLGSSFLTIGQNISAATWQALVDVLNALSPLIETVLVPLVQSVADFAKNNPGVIEKVAMAFIGFKLVSGAVGPVKSLVGTVGSAVGVFKTVGDAASILAGAFTKGGSLAGGMVEVMGLFRSANPIVSALGQGFGVFTKVLSGVSTAFKLLTVAISTNPFGAILTAVTLVGAALWAFFTKTETGRAMWSAFTGFLSSTWDTVTQALSAGVDVVKGAWDRFTSALSTGYTTYIKPVLDTIGAVFQTAFQIIGTVVLTPFMLLWEALSAAFQAAWVNIIQPSLQAMGDLFTWLWTNVVSPVIDWIVAKWNVLKDGLVAAWSWIQETVFTAMGNAFTWLWASVISPVVDWIVAKWNVLKDGLVAAWSWLQQTVFTAMGNVFNWLWSSVVSPVIDWIVAKWNVLKDGLAVVWSWIQENVFARIQSGLDVVKNAFGVAVDAIRSIWDRVRAAAAKPIRWVVEWVYNNGVVKAWNAVAKFTGMDEIAPIGLGELASYATGGILPGYTPGKDVHSFYSPTAGRLDLSGGEGIARPEVVKAMGAGGFNALNAAARSGGVAGVKKLLGQGAQFAHGGIIAFKNGGVFPNGDTKKKEDMNARIDRAFAALKSENGKKYQWGGVGNPSWDCSGLWSGIVQELNKAGTLKNGRIFNTTSLMASPGSFGFEPGLNGLVTVGVSDDHMAGTMRGVNVESASDPKGVQVGGSAWGSDNSYFSRQYTLKDFLGEFISSSQGGNNGFSLSKAVKAAWDRIVSKIGVFPGAASLGKMGELVTALPKKLLEAAWDAVTSHVSKNGAGDYTGAVGSAGNAGSWREMAIAAMRRNGFNADDPAQVDAMLAQIQSESGGNPGIAQQIVDVNGSGESAGVGLLQIIPSTFAAHRDPSLPDDRRDPWANMNAALRYYRGRYGTDLTTMWGKGHGYAAGGVLPHHIGVYDTGGVLPAGGVAVNRSRYDEVVVNGPDLKAISRLAGNVGALTNSLKSNFDSLLKNRDVVGFKDAVMASLDKYLPPLADGVKALGGSVADPRSLDGIAARSVAYGVAGILGELGLTDISSLTDKVLSSEEAFLKAQDEHASRLDTLREKTAALADAQKALAEAQAASSTSGGSPSPAAATEKVAVAEANLSQVRVESAEKTTQSEEDKASKIEAATQAVTKAEGELAEARKASAKGLDMTIYDVFPQLSQGLSQAAVGLQSLVSQAISMGGAAGSVGGALGGVVGSLSSLAVATGPAGMSLGVAISGISQAISVAKSFFDTISSVVESVFKAQSTAWSTVSSLMAAHVKLAQMVSDLRKNVVGLIHDQAMAVIELAAATRDLRIAQWDGVSSQLEGLVSVAQAQAAFDAQRQADMAAAMMNYTDLSVAYDRFRWGVAGASAQLIDDMVAWSDASHKLYEDVLAAQTNQQLLEKNAQIANLEATYKQVQALLDLNSVTASLESAAKKLAVASGQAFGMDEKTATVGEYYASLVAEKAKINANQSSFWTWVNPGNWGENGYIDQNNRRMAQIDDEIRNLEAKYGSDVINVREVNSLIDKAGSMGFWGSGDKVADLINNSSIGDATRALNKIEFENKLIDIDDKNTQLAETVSKNLAELEYQKKLYPLETEASALEREKASHETWSKYWDTQDEGVRKALADLARNQADTATSIRTLKDPLAVVYMDASKTAYSADEVEKAYEALGVRVERLENPRPTGVAVSASRRLV